MLTDDEKQIFEDYKDESSDAALCILELLNDLDRLRRASRAVLVQLDYLQSLWGKEAITHRLAEQLRSALPSEK